VNFPTQAKTRLEWATCHYSNPDAFLKYYQCLQTLELNADISLRMIVYDEALNALGRDSQFGGPQAFTTIQTNRKFTQYFAKHTSKLPGNYVDFLRVLKDREDKKGIQHLKGTGPRSESRASGSVFSCVLSTVLKQFLLIKSAVSIFGRYAFEQRTAT
jgi:hypothetical protein